ncbi:MAG TPA: alpha-amylase family glycosyl hydrolase [Holophaga sp.]|nr:alpha-amylase family glycosyl hydrolase [Holophaga sp.]
MQGHEETTLAAPARIDLRSALGPRLEALYPGQADRILEALEAWIREADIQPWMGTPPDWHHHMRLYTVYPEGVTYDPRLSPLRNLAAHIPVIRKLHCNAVHVLPFWASPRRDMGFDISDYYRIRPELGTLEDLLAFRDAAHDAGIQVIVDAVLNHASDASAWFQRAQAGSARDRDFFIHTAHAPRFLAKYQRDATWFAQYEVGGEPVEVEIAFPDLIGTVPHWRMGLDGHWYYHTYYPEELDLDWTNPDVFIEMGKVLLHWGRHGFHFRLDAIPFVGKPAYKRINVPDPATHRVVRAVKALVEAVHPNAILIAESFEDLDTVKAYFGPDGRCEAQFAYNFHLCANLWISLTKHDPYYLWKVLDRTRDIPEGARWLNFLRNHDELSLAHIHPGQVHDLLRNLMRFGKPFGHDHAVSGRTVSLLGANRARFRMAYFLLASLPGSPMVIYGDEVAFPNRRLHALPRERRQDTRNINRGVLSPVDYHAAHAGDILAFLAGLMAAREAKGAFFDHFPERMDAGERELFMARYGTEDTSLLVLVNLGPRGRVLPLDLEGLRLVTSVNRVTLAEGELALGPYGGVWLEEA